MRILSATLDSVLAAGGDGLPAMLATEAEARAYEAREALSPGVQEFVGGHGTLGGLVLLAALVLLVVYLAKEI